MNADEALEALKSTDVETRLLGARFLALNARREDLDHLTKARDRESVRWIRTALARGIERAESTVSQSPEHLETPLEPSPDIMQDVRAEAIEEVTGTIIHEFSPIIGALRVRLPRELDNHKSTESWKLVEMLSSLLRGVRELKSASAVPHYTAFDVSEVITDAIAMLDKDQREIVAPAGAARFQISADRDRLLLALGNGLRNAVDAASENSAARKPSVVINWGRAGSEDWLAIIDSGMGFKGNPASSMKMGITSKVNHIGFGLATAQQAMRAMEGDVYLSNGPDGGARFELRWFRNDAHTVR